MLLSEHKIRRSLLGGLMAFTLIIMLKLPSRFFALTLEWYSFKVQFSTAPARCQLKKQNKATTATVQKLQSRGGTVSPFFMAAATESYFCHSLEHSAKSVTSWREPGLSRNSCFLSSTLIAFCFLRDAFQFLMSP